jgi:hypothetical protein
MNATSLVTLTLAGFLAGTAAHAQQTPSSGDAASAQSAATRAGHIERNAQEDLEPAVDTSSAAQTPAAKPAQGSVAAHAAAEGTSTVATKHDPAADTARAAAAPKGAGKATDRIDLDTTSITGNRELPKVMYIVPWKSSDLGDLVGKPVNSLLDEVLEPVDRDVFKRENRYYRAVAPSDAHGSGDGANAVRQGGASSAQATAPGARDER